MADGPKSTNPQNQTIRGVIKDRDMCKGKVVLWGGVIIECKNLKEGTRVTLLQKDLNRWGRPKESDENQGRFIVFHTDYLDKAIYRRGWEITVTGEIIGEKVLPIDEIKYTYPVLSPREIHLWRGVRKAEYPYWRYPWRWNYAYWPYRRWHRYCPWYPYHWGRKGFLLMTLTRTEHYAVARLIPVSHSSLFQCKS